MKKENEPLDQDPEKRKGKEPEKGLPEPHRLHEKNKEDEMEDLYREKENQTAVEPA